MTHTVAHFFQDAAGEHRFQVKGGNGEIVVTSEGYSRPEDAVRGFERLRELLAAPADAPPADDVPADDVD
jgi:uncharacterized protein YegP (UPF0339 family)